MKKNLLNLFCLLAILASAYGQDSSTKTYAHFSKALQADYYAWYGYNGNSGVPSGKNIQIRLGEYQVDGQQLWEEYSSTQNKWIPLSTNIAEHTQTQRKYPANSTIVTKIKLDDNSWFTLNDSKTHFVALSFNQNVNSSNFYTYLNYGGGKFNFSEKNPKWYIQSGINGLDLATGLTNIITDGNRIEYSVQINDFSRIDDDAPDFILTQISEISSQADYVELLDANGQRIGNRIELNFTDNHQIGNHFIFEKNQAAVTSGNQYESSKIGAQKLYIAYFKLSDFGITNENYKNINKLSYTKASGNFNSAFFAYDQNATLFNRNLIYKNITVCKGDTTQLTFNFTTTDGVGPYSFIYSLKKDGKFIEDKTFTTNQTGGNVSFSYLFEPTEQGSYSFEFKKVSDSGKNNSEPQNFTAENITVTVLPETKTLTTPKISATTVCPNQSVSIVFSETGQANIEYILRNSEHNEVAKIQGDGKNPVQLTFSPVKTSSYTLTYGPENGTCQKHLQIGKIIVSSNPELFDFSQEKIICEGSSATLTLNNSEKNVVYQLKDSSEKVIAEQNGTGNAIFFTVSKQNEYHLTAINNAGCTTDMQGVASVKVINLSPEAQSVILCQGNTIEKLRSTIEQIFSEDVHIDMYKNDAMVTNLSEVLTENNKYSFVLSSNIINCIGNKTNIQLTLTPPEVNSDFLINVGGTMPLKDYPLSNGVWSSSNDNVVSVDNNGIAKGLQQGKASVFFTDDQGCVTEFQIEVKNECEITEFNYVSPNQDRENDYLFIKGIECFPNNELKIFNRWGAEVCHIKNYNNISNYFSGYAQNSNVTISKNSRVASGVYFATLKYTLPSGKIENKSFWIYIKNTEDSFGF